MPLHLDTCLWLQHASKKDTEYTQTYACQGRDHSQQPVMVWTCHGDTLMLRWPLQTGMRAEHQSMSLSTDNIVSITWVCMLRVGVCVCVRACVRVHAYMHVLSLYVCVCVYVCVVRMCMYVLECVCSVWSVYSVGMNWYVLQHIPPMSRLKWVLFSLPCNKLSCNASRLFVVVFMHPDKSSLTIDVKCDAK